MNLFVSLRKDFERFCCRPEFVTNSRRLGVFGRSGSGKSTLVHFLAGLLRTGRGTIELDGEVLTCSERGIWLPPEKRRIAVVFQQACLFPHLDAGKNLLYGYRRTPAELRRVDPKELIEVLELGSLLDRDVETLSGGERQRVALGRAVLASPRLLLMDEPLSALDEGLKYQIIPYLREVFERFTIPFVFVSHSMNEMRLMTDEVVVMHRGAVSDQTTPDELARKRMRRTRVGYINLLTLGGGRENDGLWTYPWGGQKLLLSAGGPEEGLYELSSKDILLFKQHPEAISARNLLVCRVGSRFELGDRVGVELTSGSEKLIAQVVRPAADELGIVEGAKVFAAIKASAFRRLY